MEPQSSSPHLETEQQAAKQPAQSDGNTAAALTYLAGWITGIVFLLTEKEDKFIRFQAAQSTALFGSITIISLIPFIGQLLALVIWPMSLILWVVLMVKAYNNERFELPIIGDLVIKVDQAIKSI